MLRNFIYAVFFMLAAVPVAVAQDGTLSLLSSAEKETVVVNEKGEKEIKRVPVSSTSVFPGDEVIFTTSYENIGKDAATAVEVTNPVPEHMVYVDETAEGKGTRVVFSVDHGKTYGPAGKLKVKDAAGKERSAVAADYTQIKWTLEKPLEKGKKGSVSFKAKVK